MATLRCSSPQDVPETCMTAFFNDQDKFKELYEQAERKNKHQKESLLPAIESVFSAFVTERKDTGRIYLMNVDHANTHGSFD